MGSFTIECPKIGSGTFDDPYRPDVQSDPKIKQLLDLLETKRQAGEEVKETVFFRVQIEEDKGTSFIVRITENIKSIDDWIAELSK